MPRIPGELVAKRTSQKKKGSDPKNTNLQFTPPIATNMEVNLRIVTLVNVEDVFCLHYGKRRTERSLTWHCPHPTSSSKFLCKLSVPIVGCSKMEAFPALSWKIQNSYVNQQMPRIPGELVAKRTSQKRKGSDPKNTNLQFTPPIATNMEVNLRIVTLVNVEVFFFCTTVKGGPSAR